MVTENAIRFFICLIYALSLVCSRSYNGQCDREMCDNGNLLDRYERLYPSISDSLMNVLLVKIGSLLILAYFMLSVSGTTKRRLLSMTSDSLLGEWIMKLK